MKKKRLLWILVLVVLLGMQAFRPARNEVATDPSLSLTAVEAVPPEVESVLRKACYDCHSNHTTYPWYANVQPIGWWMQHHIDEGKEELNFSLWRDYDIRRKIHKLEELRDEVEEGHMPISSYLWVHGDAKLQPDEKRLLLDWSRGLDQKLRMAGQPAGH